MATLYFSRYWPGDVWEWLLLFPFSSHPFSVQHLIPISTTSLFPYIRVTRYIQHSPVTARHFLQQLLDEYCTVHSLAQWRVWIDVPDDVHKIDKLTTRKSSSWLHGCSDTRPSGPPREDRPVPFSAPIATARKCIIIIVYYAEAAENIKHTHTIHAYTIKQFKHTNKNTYYVKSMR